MKEEDEGGRDPESLDITLRRQPQVPIYDPPALLLPPLPEEDEVPHLEEAELPKAESSGGVGDWVGGLGLGDVRSGGIKGRGARSLRTAVAGKGITVAPRLGVAEMGMERRRWSWHV